MKKFITTIGLLAGIALGAQTAEFHIMTSMNANLSTAFWVNTVNVKFSPYGSNFNDSLDATASITNSAQAYPFTVNSSYASLLVRDSRPQLFTQRNVPFGVWTQNSGEMHIRGEWTNPADSSLYTVTLVENATGTTWNMYNENGINITGDTSFAVRFTIQFVPKAYCLAFDESCYGSNDGSVYLKSPVQNWTVDMYLNSAFVSTINIANNDTLLTGLAQGAYDFVYILNSSIIDTSSATVSGPAQVVAAATISNVTPNEGDTVQFTNTSANASSFDWNFGDSFTSTDASPSHVYSVAGTYTVTLIAYNATGCNNTITYTVDVQMPSLAPQPHLMDRNNQQAQNTARESAVTVKSENGTAQVAMNDDAVITQFSVYSVNGQLMYTGSGNDNTFTYDTPGIYTIRIIYSDGTTDARQWFLN